LEFFPAGIGLPGGAPSVGPRAVIVSRAVILRPVATETGKKGIKSAYERALERMESEGIERPREEAFSPDVLAGMEEARKRAEAKLAELEILHQGRLRKVRDAAELANEKKEYQAERRRIEERRDRDLAALRDRSSAPGR
jgi:hypothetical protein